METTSIFFIILVLLSSVFYYGIKPSFRVFFLLILSAGFIASYKLFYLVYILLFATFNYFIGLMLSKQENNKIIFWLGITVNVLQLVFLRYTPIVIGSINTILNVELIMVPLGISFFTLQGIGYLINIQKGWEKPEHKFSHFCLFILFFPKFLSGPVERSNRFLPQLKSMPEFSEANIVSGIKQLILGIFQKVFLGSQLMYLLISFNQNLEVLTGVETFTMIILLPMVLYFDFAGYTNIALGVSKVYGIVLSPNFNKPFLSQNVSQFWRRFHMSLSYWYNDYIFKQLTFKLRGMGKLAPAISVFVTFTLFGIWHGSGINFIIIGLMQAVAINYEFFTKRFRYVHFNKYEPYLGRIITYLFYSATLVFFFNQDLKNAGVIFKNIFNSFHFSFKFIDEKILLYTLIGFSILIIHHRMKKKAFWEAAILFVMILLIFSFSNSSAFIYQNF